MNRVRLRKERNKLAKKVTYLSNTVLREHPELKSDPEYVREYFEKKVGYNPPLKYHELIRKPRPDELPRRIRQRLGSDSSSKKQFYDEEF